MSSGEEPHHARAVAESFGIDAARYDRARPRYPDALVEHVLASPRGSAVLVVGSGTGIDARQFATAGAAVLGVEPDPRMAAFARTHGTDTEEATFEGWDPAGRTFDAVVAGTSWHWVDPAAGAAKAAAVLRPGGVLALYGHVFTAPRPVADAYDTAVAEVAPGSTLRRGAGAAGGGRARSAVESYEALYATFAERIRGTRAFTEPIRWRLDWQRAYTRAGWLELLRTTGGLTSLAPPQADEVLARVGAAIGDAGITAEHATVMITARTMTTTQK